MADLPVTNHCHWGQHPGMPVPYGPPSIEGMYDLEYHLAGPVVQAKYIAGAFVDDSGVLPMPRLWRYVGPLPQPETADGC